MKRKLVNKVNLFAGEITPAKAMIFLILREHQQGRKNFNSSNSSTIINASQKGDGDNGNKLFKQNCAVCHVLTDNVITGPGLKNVYYRIPKPQDKWLKSFIMNNKKVFESGDKYAEKLHVNYVETSMPNFDESLTEQEINDIMIYVIGNTR